MLRNLIYITALIMLCNAAIAQKVSKLYVSKATETGILYFIKPREMPPAGKDIKPKESVLYDVTIHSDKDTADILMSITTLTPIVFDTVTFAYNDGESATHTLQKIYIDTKKKGICWKIQMQAPEIGTQHNVLMQKTIRNTFCKRCKICLQTETMGKGI